MKWFIPAVLAGVLAGCASTEREPVTVSRNITSKSVTGPDPAENHVSDPPPAASGGNASGDPGPAGDQPFMGLPDVVVEMDGDKITRDEFLRKSVEWYGRETIEELLLRRVIARAMADTGVTILDSDLDLRVDAVVQAKEKEVRQQYKMSLKDFLGKLGRNIEQFRAEIKANENLTRQMQLEAMLAYSYWTEPRVKLAMIVVKDAARAESLRKQLKDGADFGKLAEHESEDPDTAAKAGMLPSFIIHGIAPFGEAFEDAAFALQKKDDISPVVKTDYGFYILKLLDRVEANPQTYEAVREKIKEKGMQYTKETLEAYLRRLRAKYVKGLKYNVPDLAPIRK